MYDRPFGVEIECKSNGQGVFGTRKLLRENGFINWTNVVADGSEVEICSPILRGFQGMRELKGVMNLLTKNNYRTTECDGMHCHFDAHDLNESDIVRVMLSWQNNQDIVKQFLGERFYNDYCSCDYDEFALKNGSVWSYDGEKCFAIEPRQRLRTIEFRQHYGTLNFDDARAWILFVQAFIKNVANQKGVIKRATMEDLFKITRTYKVAQRNLAARNGKFTYDPY